MLKCTKKKQVKGLGAVCFACEEGKIGPQVLSFPVIMASRFGIVDEEYIEELKDKTGNENTKNSTE